MKRLALTVVFAGVMLILNGCAVYVPAYDNIGFSYGYVPYGGYGGYGYGYHGFRPHSYGWGGRGYGGRGYGWRGRGWH